MFEAGVKKTRNRSNIAQQKHMIDFIRKHPRLVREIEGNDPLSADLWAQLTEQLNLIPDGIVRDRRTWMKSWSDMVRSAHNRKAAVKAGTRKMLAPLDQSILDLTPNFGDTEENYVPRRSRSQSPKPEYSGRSHRVSPKHSPRQPLRQLAYSPQQGGSNRSPSRPSSRTFSYSDQRASEYNERSRDDSSSRYSLGHLPSRKLSYSPQNGSQYHGRSHHDSARPSSAHQRSSYSPRPSAHQRSSYSPRPSSAHQRSSYSPKRSPRTSAKSTSTLSSKRSRTHSTERATNGSQSQSTKPANVHFVDLTQKQTPDSQKRRPPAATTTATKGASAGASAIITALNQYSTKVDTLVEKVVERIDTQNDILEKGFANIARVVLNAVEQIIAKNLKHEPKSEEIQQSPEAEGEGGDHVNFLREDFDEEEWETEYLDPATFDDQEKLVRCQRIEKREWEIASSK